MMKTHSKFLLLPLTLLLLAAPGCSQEQLRKADGLFDKGKQAGQGLQDAAHGPASPLIPAPVQDGMELAGLGLLAAYGIWQRIRASNLLERKDDLTVTLKAVVDGIDTVPKQAEPIKAEIKQIMKDREIYSRANAIVDSLKGRGAKIP